MKELLFRHSTIDDVNEMYPLLKEHGPNIWNYLPEEGITEELRDVATGEALAILAEIGNFFQFVLPVSWGHVSVCIEKDVDPIAIGLQVMSLLEN